MKTRTLVCVLVVSAVQHAASAACVNKYFAQKEGPKVLVTVLTGMLSYPEAYQLAQAVNDKSAPPPEWVDEKGRTIAKHIGEMKVIRPMPVSCEGKASGVVLTTTFLVGRTMSGRIYIKFDANTTVALEEQQK